MLGVINEDPSVTITWLRGTRLEGDDLRSETERVVDALEAVDKRA